MVSQGEGKSQWISTFCFRNTRMKTSPNGSRKKSGLYIVVKTSTKGRAGTVIAGHVYVSQEPLKSAASPVGAKRQNLQVVSQVMSVQTWCTGSLSSHLASTAHQLAASFPSVRPPKSQHILLFRLEDRMWQSWQMTVRKTLDFRKSVFRFETVDLFAQV